MSPQPIKTEIGAEFARPPNEKSAENHFSAKSLVICSYNNVDGRHQREQAGGARHFLKCLLLLFCFFGGVFLGKKKAT